MTPRVALTSSLLMAGRQWRRLAQHVLAEHEVSEARGTALLWVRRLGGGVHQVALASYVGVVGAAMVRLLDELSASGLVERRNDPNDRRCNAIWLTEAGERLAERIESSLATLRDRVLSDVSDDDIAATLRVFDALARADEARGQPALAVLET